MRDKDATLIYEAYRPLNEGKMKQVITALDAGDTVDQIIKDLNLPDSARSAIQSMHDRYYEKGEKAEAEDNIGADISKFAGKVGKGIKSMTGMTPGVAAGALGAAGLIGGAAANIGKKLTGGEDGECPMSDEEFTEKSAEIEAMLTQLLGGKNRRSYIAAGKCIITGEDAGPFRDELSKREYMISGMGQEAQDQIFGDNEEEQEVKQIHVIGYSEDQEGLMGKLNTAGSMVKKTATDALASDAAKNIGSGLKTAAGKVAKAASSPLGQTIASAATLGAVGPLVAHQLSKKDKDEEQESADALAKAGFSHVRAEPKTRFDPSVQVRYNREAEGKTHEAIENLIVGLYDQDIVQSEVEAFSYLKTYLKDIEKGHIAGVPND